MTYFVDWLSRRYGRVGIKVRGKAGADAAAEALRHQGLADVRVVALSGEQKP